MRSRRSTAGRFIAAAGFATVLSLAAALLLFGCSEKPVSLRIYFTADDSGFLTPCG